MFNRILVVCTGNICRSPMAEVLLRARLQGRSIASAGIAALIGEPADPRAVDVARAHGLDLDAHRARQATLPMLSDSDLILVMERLHADWINRNYPQLRGRVHGLGHWRSLEIADPYQCSLLEFEKAYEEIEAAVADWLPKLV